VLYRAGGDATYLRFLMEQLDQAAPSFGMESRVYYHTNRPEDLEPLFAAIKRDGFDVLYLIATSFSFGHRTLIADAAARQGLAVLAEHRQFAADGALVSYGVDGDEVQRHLAMQVDKVLRGARPETLPINQPTKLYLALNLKTARALKIDIAPNIVARADNVIE
jgi:putative tryptophan/tyrosine transport system substrate-binding protein